MASTDTKYEIRYIEYTWNPATSDWNPDNDSQSYAYGGRLYNSYDQATSFTYVLNEAEDCKKHRKRHYFAATVGS